MPLKIRQAPFVRGSDTFQVHPDDVRAHIGVIAMTGTDELPPSLGEDTTPADPDFNTVTYDPGPQDSTTARGRVRARLKELVDHATTFEVLGMGFDFVWSDGDTIEASPGGTLGQTVFYDTTNCNGDGRWIRGTNGDEECTTAAGILYHELGHAFINLTDSFHPEADAVAVENDFREALGLVARDTSRLESSCGCPDDDCCIVASIATNSPFSAEVNALRRIRDYSVRNSLIGERFFDLLHREYYSFSVEVCRTMVQYPRAKADVEHWLVRPLTHALSLVALYVRNPSDQLSLGTRILSMRQEAGEAKKFLHAVREGIEPPLAEFDEGTQAICRLLMQRIPACPYVAWAILDLLQIQVNARSFFPSGSDPLTVGHWTSQALDEWLGSMPVDLFKDFTTDQLRTDLAEFSRRVCVTPGARRKLGTRIAARFPTLECVLRQGEYL